MNRVHSRAWFLLPLLLATTGCFLRNRDFSFREDLAHFEGLAQTMAYPDAEACAAPISVDSFAPNSIHDSAEPVPRPMTLEEAIATAIARSSILRDLGASIIRAPGTIRSIHGPGIVSSDPQRGMEAALSEFDAELATGLFFDKNDRMLNNFLTAGGTNVLQQDLDVFRTELKKRSASGTELFLRSDFNFDANNAQGNRFPEAYDSLVETEIRQPLLQGAGATFNRIAGPNSAPGLINGIVVARLNTDVSLIDFELGIRDFVSNVENAYWDLYFAYRDLDAKIEARNRSLVIWRAIVERMESGQTGGDAEREAQFREQYLRFEDEVQSALTGRLLERTSTYNGSTGGTFRAIGGVYTAERRLRLLMGLAINDGTLLQPVDEPTRSPVYYEWSVVLAEAISRRCELRRQRLDVRRRELELIANRNFLLPRFDLVGRYRYRGLGRNFIGGTDLVNPAPDDPFANGSLNNLFSGDFQEWQLGAELTFPIGFRRAHAAVRHAQLQHARSVALLQEQERQVIHDLSNAKSDVDRAYLACQTNYNRRLAALKQASILRANLESGRVDVNFDQLIDAERRLADADTQYYRALVEYMLAIKNLHFEKGSLLEYCQVHLAEASGSCGDAAFCDSCVDGDKSYRLLDYVLRREPVADQADQAEASAAPEQSLPSEPLPPSHDPGRRELVPPPPTPPAPAPAPPLVPSEAALPPRTQQASLPSVLR